MCFFPVQLGPVQSKSVQVVFSWYATICQKHATAVRRCHSVVTRHGSGLQSWGSARRTNLPWTSVTAHWKNGNSEQSRWPTAARDLLGHIRFRLPRLHNRSEPLRWLWRRRTKALKRKDIGFARQLAQFHFNHSSKMIRLGDGTNIEQQFMNSAR